MRTDYEIFEVEPLTPGFGAEVVGVHMGDIDDEAAEAIDDAWLDWKVLFFRDQHIEPVEHIAFARHFGEPEVHPYLGNDGNPEVVVLDSGGDGPYQANFWHTDVSFRECPPKGSVLRGRIIPAVGGDTCWVDMEKVYESLDDATKEQIDDATATHTMRKTFGAQLRGEELEAQLEEYPDQHHPVVRTHPVTGRRCLYVNGPFVDTIDGMDDDEGRRLLKHLLRQGHRPEHQVRFRWRPDSFAMWDNRCTQHYAVHDYTERRRVERVTLIGDRPV